MKAFIIIALCLALFIGSPAAQTEVFDAGQVKAIALPLHIIELVLALFICYMSLKFFRITKPINMFLIIYVALGFFIVNIALYLLFYSGFAARFEPLFVNVYLGSRIALIGMLISFVLMFYQWNKTMRQSVKK